MVFEQDHFHRSNAQKQKYEVRRDEHFKVFAALLPFSWGLSTLLPTSGCLLLSPSRVSLAQAHLSDPQRPYLRDGANDPPLTTSWAGETLVELSKLRYTYSIELTQHNLWF